VAAPFFRLAKVPLLQEFASSVVVARLVERTAFSITSIMRATPVAPR
jgi:hypothetical protein